MTTPAKLRVRRLVDLTVDRLCDEFEGQLKEGQSPSLDDYLSQVPETDRIRTFRELLLVQLSYVPAERHVEWMEQCLELYPQYADLICSAWVEPGAADVGGTTDQAVCPHCRMPLSARHETSESPVARSANDPPIPSATPARLPARFLHHYRLLNEIGQGTFGTVYRAFDTKLGRMVAIKIPRPGQLTDDEQEMRFLREARSAGQLDHPGIVKVLDAGYCRDTHYIVYDYFAGTSLAERIAKQPLTPREAATLVCQVAEALEHAHERQIIHRDLKTANILVNDQGVPKLTDFGLARAELSDASLTAVGSVLGTPGYMSPEQAQGGSRYADRRSDVYSLGVILFELLTGERPFRGTIQGVLQQVINDKPPAPSSLVPSMHRDLDEICLKCLEKSPLARYATARALADDLRRWLEGQRLVVRPASRWPSRLRWALHHKLALTLTLLAVLLLLATGALAVRNVLALRRTNQQWVTSYLRLLRQASAADARVIADSLKSDRATLVPLLDVEIRRAKLTDAERQQLRGLLSE